MLPGGPWRICVRLVIGYNAPMENMPLTERENRKIMSMDDAKSSRQMVSLPQILQVLLSSLTI